MPDKNVIDKKIDKTAKAKPGGLRKVGSFFVRLGRRLKNFFGNMKTELKRVVWPDRKKLVQNTATVLAICMLAGLLLWVIDISLQTILNGIGFYSTQPTTTTTTYATSAATTSASGETTTGTTASSETSAGTTAAATTAAETTAAATTTAGG